MAAVWTEGAALSRPPPSAAFPRATAADLIESALVAALMVLTASALLAPLANPTQAFDTPGWIKLVWPPCYAVILGLMLYRRHELARIWVAALPALALVGWVYASMAWTIDPHLSPRRALAFAFGTLFGIYLATFNWRRLIELFAFTLCLLAVCSAIAALAFPWLGVHQGVHAGAWKGVWFEKNALGAWMAFGVLACLSASALSPRRRWAWLGGALLCAGLLKMSTSATALVALVLVAGGFAAIGFLRRGPAPGVLMVWLTAVGLLAAVTVLLVDSQLVFGVVDRDPTFSGRTEIWDALVRRWREVPWTGYGYGAFWSRESDPANIVRHEVNWVVRNADNAWMQVLIELGAVGVTLLAGHITATATAAVRSLGKGPEAYWSLLFLVVLCGYSISESNLMRPNDLIWALYVATSVKLFAGEGRPMAQTDRRVRRGAWLSS